MAKFIRNQSPSLKKEIEVTQLKFFAISNVTLILLVTVQGDRSI